MKFKTTKKNMKDGFYKIISVGYCNLQHLLNYENPIAYSTRAEGWACDYYDIDGILICEGYAPIKEKNMKSDYKTIRKYDKLAQGQSAEMIKKLLKRFISECEMK